VPTRRARVAPGYDPFDKLRVLSRVEERPAFDQLRVVLSTSKDEGKPPFLRQTEYRP
jgi:hypothetical protein